mmetsp:Transcript_9392/g.29180  ORF Transcript_9392/g.29180 Transcript_9392/m.29180 type:complete len:516 (-) Transcript_9392:31-1578(-)
MSTRALLLLGVCGVALQPSRPPHHPKTRRHAATQEPPPADKPPLTPPTPPPPKPVTGPWQWSPDQQKAETEVAAWRRSVTSADFDDALVFRLFRRQFEVLLPDFEPKEQLAVSARRGRASLRRLNGDARAINKLFNPLCTDTNWPLQLTRCACDAVSIAWTSVFTLNRDPLEVRISKAELDFDQKLQRPTNAELRRAGIEWRSLFGPLPSYMREHPTVEGARYLIDELVCVARRVETPFARGSNATLRVTFSGVDARSVDNSSRVADLKKCWASFNTPPNQKYAFIAKRIVAREMVVELCFEGDARAEAAAAAVRNAAEIAFAPTTIRIAPPGTGHDEPPVLDMDPLRLLSRRTRRSKKTAPVVVEEPHDPHEHETHVEICAENDQESPPTEEEEAPPPPEPEFVEVFRAPTPAALVTFGYDSPANEVASVRFDLDLRRGRVSLTPDTLREPARRPGDVDLGVFMRLGSSGAVSVSRPVDDVPGGVGGRVRRVLRDRVVRPFLALFILAWGLRLF